MKAQTFVQLLEKQGIDSYYGVPDSLLKSICAYITDTTDSVHNIITANEGNAIGMACGHYLATGRPALVYMQNSGQGNVINPLLSLMDEEVYNIPVLLLIGWRGEPGIHDEPQHVKQGKVTLSLLETMGISCCVLSEDEEIAARQITEACTSMQLYKRPYALIARKNTFESYKLQSTRKNHANLSREEAICSVAAALEPGDIVVSTTGMISRELYEYRTRSGSSHQSDFLTVGAMGHSSSIAMGVALNKPGRRVVCLDGDGAFLMHMGAAAVVGNAGLQNLRHIVLNNAAHDSVGGQPTVANKLNIGQIAKACGYSHYYQAATAEALTAILPDFLTTPGVNMLEINVKCGSRSDLGRPKEKPRENKASFMRFVEEPGITMQPGAFSKLAAMIAASGWKSLLIFTTEGRKKALQKQIEQQCAGCSIVFYTAISPNPSTADVTRAFTAVLPQTDAIIAIGGGSVIDFAKLYRACLDNDITLEEHFASKSVLIRKTPLVAIPTTAGTGSESTRFAVVYLNGEKYSLDDASVMPDYALVDGELMVHAPKYQKASCGMDAFAQAMEGYWARGASPESDIYALRAIELCRDNLVRFVNTTDVDAAQNMAEASNLAGRCISISRTTAAHALSYKITQWHAIPHGHAVALSLPGLADFHYHHAEANSLLFQKMQTLATLLHLGSGDFRQYFRKLYTSISLNDNLSELGISHVDAIAKSCNAERLGNNPLPLNSKELTEMFS